MLKVQSVQKWYSARPVLKDVSFSLSKGQVTGLVGPSGSGKSVLLKLVGGVEQPDRGEISHRIEEGGQVSVGFLFQEGALFDSMTVLENVAFPLQHAPEEDGGPVERSSALDQAYRTLSQVGLGEAYRKYPGQLSGGMRRRVGIARALVGRPDLVLLDDPTGGLDPVAASVIMNLIRSLHAEYRPTVLMVSHDLRRLLPSVERVLCLFDGVLCCDEPVEHLAERVPPSVLRFLRTRYDFDNPQRA